MAVGTAPANGIEIAYETFGSPTARPLLLIMGLGMQLLGWGDEVCQEFAARDFFTVRFDNRDTGLSTHLHDSSPPDLRAVLSGDLSSVAYSIRDMADDTAGLLDALDIDSAHVVGVSLGGMIAQTLATEHPDRVRSLISIMSAPAMPLTDAEVGALSAAPARTRDEAVAGTLELFRLVRSPAYPFDEARIADLAGRAYDRSYDPAGALRQRLAIHVAGDRTQALRRVRVPTLVVHGEDDPVMPVTSGRATAEAIPGAELMVVPGMGHDLPRPLWPTLIDAIVRTADRAS